MAGRVSGKVALITGGGSGIGRATAIVFGREGAKVVIADYNRDGGEQTVHMIKNAGGEASFIEANVAIAKQAEAMVARTIETYGRLDCAFNNAGIEGQMGGNIADCSEENWGRIIAINLTGVFLCMRYEIPQMLKQGGGSIVNTASAAPHLASHLLARVAGRIATDWQALYEHPVYLLETFIDPERFAGTCYRAANWLYLGLTTGRGKDDQTNRPNRSLKQLWAYPLRPDFRRRLCGAGCG